MEVNETKTNNINTHEKNMLLPVKSFPFNIL